MKAYVATRLKYPHICVQRHRFQAQNFEGDVEGDDADDSKDDYEYVNGVYADDSRVERRRCRKVAEESQAEFMLFLKIVREYIIDGATNEINIRY